MGCFDCGEMRAIMKAHRTLKCLNCNRSETIGQYTTNELAKLFPEQVVVTGGTTATIQDSSKWEDDPSQLDMFGDPPGEAADKTVSEQLEELGGSM